MICIHRIHNATTIRWLSGISMLLILIFNMLAGTPPALADNEKPSEQERQQIEITFLTKTIDHHEGAIQMARLAEQRATHTELKTLATKIIENQTQQQQQMQQWLKQWYNITKEPKITEDSKAMVQRLSGLTGAEFEITFMRDMIKHHQIGIPMMEPEEKNGAHREARQLAKKMIKDQKKEIKQMQQWLKKWYNTGME